MLANGTKEWVSMGIMYQDTKMWVGQIASFALRGETNNLAAVSFKSFYVLWSYR